MNREDYRAARQAEQALATTPPAVRELVNGVVAGTVATANVTPKAGTVTVTVTRGGAAPTTTNPGEPS